MLLKKTGKAFVFKGGFLKCKGTLKLTKLKINFHKKINYSNNALKKRLVEPSFLKGVFEM